MQSTAKERYCHWKLKKSLSMRMLNKKGLKTLSLGAPGQCEWETDMALQADASSAERKLNAHGC